MTFADLHLHLLPGVDDGPATLAASLEHAARIAAGGVREAVVTPHVGHPDFPVEVAEIAPRTAALQAELDAAEIPLLLRPGGEIHAQALGRLSADELDAVAQGPRGARWVLAEVPFAGIDDAFLAGCRKVRRRGFGLLIAHPERAAGFLDGGLAALVPEIAAGAVLQVNVASLLGRHGAEARVGAERLVRERLAYVLASDGHPPLRVQTLPEGREAAIAAGASPLQARQLTQANPAFLLRHGIVLAATAHRPWRGAFDGPVNAALDAARRLGRATAR